MSYIGDKFQINLDEFLDDEDKDEKVSEKTEKPAVSKKKIIDNVKKEVVKESSQDAYHINVYLEKKFLVKLKMYCWNNAISIRKLLQELISSEYNKNKEKLVISPDDFTFMKVDRKFFKGKEKIYVLLDNDIFQQLTFISFRNRKTSYEILEELLKEKLD